jgi:hypothetical protein
LFVSEDGKIIGESQQTALLIAPLQSGQKVSLSSAPEAVQKTIREQAGSAQVSDVDKGTWQGQSAYKVMVEKNGKPMPLVISENGTLLSGAFSEAAGAEKSNEQSKDAEQSKGAQQSEQQK